MVNWHTLNAHDAAGPLPAESRPGTFPAMTAAAESVTTDPLGTSMPQDGTGVLQV
jgi:hypothetical protein